MNLRRLILSVVGVVLVASLAAVLIPHLLGLGRATAAPVASKQATKDISCVPVQVAVFTTTERLHVRCAASVGGISYFALSTSKAALAGRVLSILTTAQVAGRTLGIRYNPDDLSGAAIGCHTNDCRLILEVWFGK